MAGRARYTFDDFMRELRTDPERAERDAEWKPSRDLAIMLVRLRLSLGLTQAEFAQRAGVRQSYISQLESGSGNPSIRSLSRLLRKNGVTLRFEPIIECAPADLATDPDNSRAESLLSQVS